MDRVCHELENLKDKQVGEHTEVQAAAQLEQMVVKQFVSPPFVLFLTHVCDLITNCFTTIFGETNCFTTIFSNSRCFCSVTGTEAAGVLGCDNSRSRNSSSGRKCSNERHKTRQTLLAQCQKHKRLSRRMIDVVKDRRMSRNGVEFLIGLRDFPLHKDHTLEPITILPGSEHMIAEFDMRHHEEYKIKMTAALIDKRNTVNKMRRQGQMETPYDDDEEGNFEEGVSENAMEDSVRTGREEGVKGQSRTVPKGTVMCQVGGHVEFDMIRHDLVLTRHHPTGQSEPCCYEGRQAVHRSN